MKCGSRSCTRDFRPRAEGHRYCSRKCAQREYSASLYGSSPTPEGMTCARAQCGARFTPRAKHQRFCSTACGVRTYNALPKAEKHSRRATKAQRHPNTELIHALRQEVGPMRCIYCEERLTSVKAYICKDPECRSSYHRDYAAIRRKRAREALPIAQPAERECKCGCGARFVPKYSTQLFLDPKHTRAHVHRIWRAKRSAARAEARASGRATGSSAFRTRRGKGILFAKGTRLQGREYAAG